MGREVRRVPRDWQHPHDDSGRPIPLFDGSWREACEKYQRQVVLWAAGAHPDQAAAAECDCLYYWQWAGNPPPPLSEPGSYMYDVVPDDRPCFQLYETTTEGTPMGPVFADLDSLCTWAADNASVLGTSNFIAADGWRSMLDDGRVTHEEKIGDCTVVFL